MRSTFGGFNTVVRGIFANQTALDTTGHNVSNAGTEGYSRQLVNLTEAKADTIYGGAYGSFQVGAGVEVSSIKRARESLVDAQIWKEAGNLAYNDNKQQMLGKVESAFGEPGTTGIQTVLNTFWQSWQDLATHASDDGSRTVVREDGVALVDSLQHSAEQLKNMVTDINDTISARVDTVNETTSQIAQLNKKIFLVEAAGSDNANDLRDQRDALVDQLSKIIDTKVTEDKNGNYIVQTGCGYVLADATSSTRLAVNQTQDEDYGYYKTGVIIAGSSPKQVVDFKDGEIKSLIDSRDSTTAGVKGYLNNISTMSQYLLTEFNAVHRAGYGTDNSTGNNFFGTSNADYTTTPMPAGTFPKQYWLDQLQVNPVLYSPGGLAKIAAKGASDTIVVTQSNQIGGNATISSFSGSYNKGTNPTSVVVTITANPAGDISYINYKYTSDNGATWTQPTVSPGTPLAGPGPFNLSINGISLTLNIPSDSDNVTGNTYNFSLSQGNTASGDNALKMCSSLKSDTSVLLNQTTLDNYYSSMIGALGIQKQDAKRTYDNQQTLVNQLDNWRQSVSGVNIDEEMTNMIKYQKGYNAAARVMTTMDEMLDKLINSTGVVGR